MRDSVIKRYRDIGKDGFPIRYPVIPLSRYRFSAETPP